MADKLASALTALTAANVDASADFALLHDTGAGELKRMTVAEYSKLWASRAGLYSAADYGTGTSNTEIQAAIDAANTAGGGTVVIPAGTWTLTDTIVIKDNVHIVCSPGATITQAAATNKSLIETAGLNAATSGVTIAWTVGPIATVTWTAHGLTTRDSIVVQGANEGEYNNVFHVTKVIDANSFTIRTYRTPTASATGTITAKACTKNFSISGGVWDYDKANNPSGTQSPDRHIMVLAFASRFSVDDVTLINATKFGLNTCAAIDYRLTRIRGYNCSDLVKHYGPSINGVLSFLSGQSNDDPCSIQAKEPAAFIAYQPAFGDVFGATIENIDVRSHTSGSGGVVVYASDSEQIHGVRLRNIIAHSETGSGISLQYGSLYTTGKITDVVIDGAYTNGLPSTKFSINVSCKIDTLMIRNWEPTVADLATQLFRQESTSTIQSLIVENFTLANTSWSTGTVYMFNFNGGIGSAVFRGGYVNASSTARFLTIGTGAVGAVAFEQCVFDTMAIVCVQQAGASASRQITMIGCRTTGISQIISPVSHCNINLLGNYFENASLGVVRPATTTGKMADIYGSGNTFAGTSVACVNTGTAYAEVHSFDMPIDVGATGFVKTASDQYAFNNGTGRGTLDQNRLVVCDGTNWKQVDDTTKVF